MANSRFFVQNATGGFDSVVGDRWHLDRSNHGLVRLRGESCMSSGYRRDDNERCVAGKIQELDFQPV
jgi:hypothetical protein